MVCAENRAGGDDPNGEMGVPAVVFWWNGWYKRPDLQAHGAQETDWPLPSCFGTGQAAYFGKMRVRGTRWLIFAMLNVLRVGKLTRITW